MSEKQTTTFLPMLEWALPLYTRAAIGTLEACHRRAAGHQTGIAAVADKSEAWIATACAESQRADRLVETLVHLDDQSLLDYDLNGKEDFELITAAGFFMEHEGPEPELGRRIADRSNEALLAALLSPSGSLLVDYDWLYADVIGYDLVNEDDARRRLLEQSLAHNLRYAQGDKALNILGAIAEERLLLGQTDDGVEAFAALLRHSPSHFDTYEHAAYALTNAGFPGAAHFMAGTTHRRFCSDSVHGHFAEDLLFTVGLANTTCEGRDGPVVDTLEKALDSGSRAGGRCSLDALARQLVPDIDDVPVKRLPLCAEAIGTPIPTVWAACDPTPPMCATPDLVRRA